MAENTTKSKSSPTKKKPVKKPISDAKRQANRENARKSTGPKTSEGKSTAKRNSLKHGMRAVGLVLIPGDDEDAYHHRRTRWIEEQKPTSDVELYLLEDLVDASWLLDRCKTYNAARVAPRVRSAIDRFDINAAKRVRKLIDRLSNDAHPDIASRLLRTSVEGCEYLLGRFNWLLGSMAHRGIWYPSEKDEVFRLFGHRPDEIFSDGFGVDLFDAFATASWINNRDIRHNWMELGLTKPEYMTEIEYKDWLNDKVPTCLQSLVPDLDGKAGTMTPEIEDELAGEKYFARVELEALLRAEIERVTARRDEVLERHLRNRAESPKRASCDVSPRGQTIHRYEQMYRRAIFTILAKRALARVEPEGEPLSASPPAPTPPSPTTDMDLTNAKLQPTPSVSEAPVVPVQFAPNEATAKVYAGPNALPRKRFRRQSFHPRMLTGRPALVAFGQAWEVEGLSDPSEWSGQLSKLPCLVSETPLWSPFD